MPSIMSPTAAMLILSACRFLRGSGAGSGAGEIGTAWFRWIAYSEATQVVKAKVECKKISFLVEVPSLFAR